MFVGRDSCTAVTSHSHLSCRAQRFLDSSGQHPHDLCTPTVDDVEIDSETSLLAPWEHYRHWKRTVRRWNRTADIPVARTSNRQLKKLDWSMQIIKFEPSVPSLCRGWNGSDKIVQLMERVDDLNT